MRGQSSLPVASMMNIVAVPLTMTSAGIISQIAFNSDFLYICIATNTWRRVLLEAF